MSAERPRRPFHSLRVFAADVSEGLRWSLHHGLVLVGLLALVLPLTLWLNPRMQWRGEAWLLARLKAAQPPLAQVTAMDLLTEPQRRVARWLADKYRVSPEAVAALVAEAHALATPQLPPHLILAVMAIESNFHPFIQSEAGAQGLMQVMPQVHAQRYREFGGPLAAFDPLVNLRVGVRILQDCVRLKGGSVDAGLRFYLGGGLVEDDGGYVAKVRAEQSRLDRVARGQAVPLL